MTGYSENAEPHRASSVVRRGGLEAARQRRQRHPAVRQPARHDAPAPSRATWASPIGRSRRTAPACRTCAWPAASNVDAHGRPQGAAGELRRRSPRHRRQRHHEGPGRLHRPRLRHGRLRHRPQGARPDARRAAQPRPLQGRRAVPDGPPADRGRRRLRDAGHRRLGHAQQQLQDAASSSCRRWIAASPT